MQNEEFKSVPSILIVCKIVLIPIFACYIKHICKYTQRRMFQLYSFDISLEWKSSNSE